MSDSSGVGKLLPNLKVTVGDEHSTAEIPTLEDGEILDNTESQSAVIAKKELTFKWASTSKTEKIHPNKYGGFETGLDLSSDVLIKKLENRAARFGLKKEEQRQITSKEIEALYKSLGLDPENLESNCKNIRLDTIHMRGVKEMKTEDVLSYFKDYGPSSIEWINDISCNVCWSDNVSAARALLGVSQPVVIKRNTKNQSEAKGSSENGGSSNSATAISEEHEVKELTTTEDYSAVGLKITKMDDVEVAASQSETPMEVVEETSSCAPDPALINIEFDIPIPPGHWRLGVAHPKASTLLLRFAAKDDKKLPGAEKRSQFYQKYGNPNYGGLRGIISNSRKRKYQAMHTRQVVESLSSKYPPSPTSDVKRIRQRLNIPVHRMRMYADIEEEKIAQRSSRSHRESKNRLGVKSRLGKRYSKDDLRTIGSQFSYEEDDPVEELSVECKIPSRFSIWNAQARSMAREEKRELEEEEEEEGSNDDEEEEDLDDEEEEYSRRKEKRYCAYGSERASYESRKQYGYSDYSKDLREALHSSRHRNRAPQSDLRSRIGDYKRDSKSQKYRSPMFRDDL